MKSLGVEFPVQQARLRDLISAYEDLRGTPGVNVEFAIAAIRDVQRRADEAAMSGDVVQMIRLYEEMQACA